MNWKYIPLFLSGTLLTACATLKSPAVKPQSEVYHMLIEDENGAWDMTPSELQVDIIPHPDGFWRVQQIAGPGVIVIDSLLLSHHGLPLRHIMVRPRRTITRVEYRKDELISTTNGETIHFPMLEYPVWDMIQMDLFLRGLDTLGNVEEAPLVEPNTGNMYFLAAQTLRTDSTRMSFSSVEKIPTIHRYASAPGYIYEAWYREDSQEMLPIKISVSTKGNKIVYYRMGL